MQPLECSFEMDVPGGHNQVWQMLGREGKWKNGNSRIIQGNHGCKTHKISELWD
jgi:hypothetical protein